MDLYRFVFFYPFYLVFLYLVPYLVVYLANLVTWRIVLTIVALLLIMGIAYTGAILITGMKVFYAMDNTLALKAVILCVAVAMGIYVSKIARTLFSGVSVYEGHASIFIQTQVNQFSRYMLRLEDDQQYFKTEVEISHRTFSRLRDRRKFPDTQLLVCNGTIHLWYLPILNIALNVIETSPNTSTGIYAAGREIST